MAKLNVDISDIVARLKDHLSENYVPKSDLRKIVEETKAERRIDMEGTIQSEDRFWREILVDHQKKLDKLLDGGE